MNGKLMCLVLCAGCTVFFADSAFGQSEPSNHDPKEVLAEYYAAVGSRGAISDISALHLSGSFIAQGSGTDGWTVKGTFEEFRSTRPYRLSAFYYADTLFTVGASPEQDFVYQPGLSDFVFIESVRTRDVSPVPFTNPDTVHSTRVLKKPGLHEVALRDVGGTKWQVHFDSETALPVRARKTQRIAVLGQDCEITLHYFDFQKVRGVKLPHKIEKSACDLGTVTYLVEQYRVPDQPFNRDLFRIGIFKKLLTRN